MENTNSNKTMTSGPYNTEQEQQQVREMILCCILLWLYTFNQHSYSNLFIQQQISSLHTANASTNYSCPSVDKPVCYHLNFDFCEECFLAIGLCVHLISIYFVYRFQIMIAYKTVMMVEKNRWDLIFTEIVWFNPWKTCSI